MDTITPPTHYCICTLQVLSMEDISKNIDSISKLLTGVFLRRRLLSSQDNIESDEEDTVTEAALREYLLSNSTSNNQIL